MVSTTMNGCTLPGTNISVDFWKIRNQHCSNLTFFLTHLHGDHTIGLTSSWQQLIYCTEITALLLEKRYGIARRYLRPLEVNSSHMIITDEIKNTTISVTVIEANHCPGAAMFLFEGDFGKILHTGDFRYDPSMFDASSPLSSHVGDIDAVYLDNTFCSPDCMFPRREEVQEEMLQLIQSFPEHHVVIGTRKLGKEALLVWLAEKLQEWISVSGDQFAVAEVLDLPRVFKLQDSECRIRTVPFNMVCKKNMRMWNAERPTVAILPSAIYKGIGGEPFVNQNDVYVVPYSDHSSFTELNEFVSKLKPSKVVPIVSAHTKGPFGISLKSRADMSVFDKFCLGTDKRCRSLVSSQPSQIHHQSPGSNSSVSKPRLVKARSKPRLNHKVPIVKGVQFCSEDLESAVDLGNIESKEKGSVCTQYEIKKTVNNCTEKNTGSTHVVDPVIIVIEDEEEDEIPREGGGSVTEHPTDSQMFDISLMSNPCTEPIDTHKPDVMDPVVIVIEEEDEIPCEDNSGSVAEHPTDSQVFGISLMSNSCTEPIDPCKPDVIDPVAIVIEDEEDDEIPCEDTGGSVTEHPIYSQVFDISLMSNRYTESIDLCKPDDEDGRALSLQSMSACHKETDSHKSKASLETDCNPFLKVSCNSLDLLHDDGICSNRELHQDKELFGVTNLQGCGVCRTKASTEKRTDNMRTVEPLSASPCAAKKSTCSNFGRIKSLGTIPNSKETSALDSCTTGRRTVFTTGRRTMSLGIIPLTNARNSTGRKRPFEHPQCQAGTSGGCQSEVDPSQEIHSPKTKSAKETDDSIPQSNADGCFDTDSFCSIYTESSNSVEFSAGSFDATLDDTDMVDCDPVAELVDTHTSTSNHSHYSRKGTVPSNEPSPSLQEPSEISYLASVSSNSETKDTITSNESSPSLQEPSEVSSLDSVSSNSETKSTIPSNETSPSLQEPSEVSSLDSVSSNSETKSTIPSNETSPSLQEPSEVSSLDSVSSNSETKSTIPSNETSPSLQEPSEIVSLDSKNETVSGPLQVTLEALFQSKPSSSSSSSTSSESTSAMNKKNHNQLQHNCTTNDNNLMDTAQPEPSENNPLVIVSAENQPIDKRSVPGRKRNDSEMESLDGDRNASVSVSKKSKMFPFGLSVKSVSECNEKTAWMRSMLNIHK